MPELGEPTRPAPADPLGVTGYDDQGDALAAAMGGLYGRTLPADGDAGRADPDDLTSTWDSGLGLHDAWSQMGGGTPVPLRSTTSTPPL